MGAVVVKTAATSCTQMLLEREGHALSKLSHPHIITLHGYCEEVATKDLHGLLLEVCDCSLADELQSQTACGDSLMGDTQRHRAAQQLLSGLDGITMQGFVHCDIKCENVLVKRRPGSSVFDVKICDFGLVDKIGSVNEAWGTCCYMAPEVMEANTSGAKIAKDPRSDMWSVGIVLLEMASSISLWDAFSGPGVTQLETINKVHKSVKRGTFLEDMTILAKTRCEPQWLWLAEWCLQPNINDRPWPGQALDWLQSNTVGGDHGEVVWRTGTTHPLPASLQQHVSVRCSCSLTACLHHMLLYAMIVLIFCKRKYCAGIAHAKATNGSTWSAPTS
jgi:serine/threonine protein kinase